MNFRRLQILLDSNEHRIKTVFRDGQVIFLQGGDVASNGFFDIPDSFLFGYTLASTARQAWALNDRVTVFSL